MKYLMTVFIFVLSFLIGQPGFGGLLDAVKSVSKGPPSLGGSGSNSALRADHERCMKEGDEFRDNVEYNAAAKNKIIAKLGKPAKIVRTTPDDFLARWSFSKWQEMEVACNSSTCEVHCLQASQPEKGNLYDACKADVDPFNSNVDCNVDNCPKKLEEAFGHKAKLSLNEPGNRVNGVLKYSDKQHKSGSDMKDVVVDFSCTKQNCYVGCKLD